MISATNRLELPDQLVSLGWNHIESRWETSMDLLREEQITSQLQPLIREIHSEHYCYGLVDSWVSAGIGPEEVIEPVLQFMEQHLDIDFGIPGPLVHFMERSWRKDEVGRDHYEELLIASIQRKPTPYTIWMVNRILNVITEPGRRNRILDALRDSRECSQQYPEILVEIERVLARQTVKGL